MTFAKVSPAAGPTCSVVGATVCWAGANDAVASTTTAESVCFIAGTSRRRWNHGFSRGTACIAGISGSACCARPIGGRHPAFSLAPERARAVMAFEAYGKDHGPLEKFGVCGAVRHMACHAAFHADAGVFEDKRAAFIDMALQAGLLIVVRSRYQFAPVPIRQEAALKLPFPGYMAVGTLHYSFIHAMLDWHVELGANRGVTRCSRARSVFSPAGILALASYEFEWQLVQTMSASVWAERRIFAREKSLE